MSSICIEGSQFSSHTDAGACFGRPRSFVLDVLPGVPSWRTWPINYRHIKVIIEVSQSLNENSGPALQTEDGCLILPINSSQYSEKIKGRAFKKRTRVTGRDL